MDSGVLSVTTHGHLLMHKWYAHRLDNTQVKSSQRVHYSIMCYNNSCVNEPTAGVPRAGAYYGQGTVPVFFDSLSCKGSENQVTQCSFTTGTSCAHSQDVGVQCVGMLTKCVCLIA